MDFFRWSHNLLNRIEGRLRRVRLEHKFQLYKQQIAGNHPLKDFPMRNIGDMSADPHELFSHYAGYSMWLAKKLKAEGGGRRF